jgi:hypothetical protein
MPANASTLASMPRKAHDDFLIYIREAEIRKSQPFS